MKDQLIALLKKREISLYYACQLTDFWSFLTNGGISSKAVLETKGQLSLCFSSDTLLKQNQTWNKVILKISDAGAYFFRYAKGIPNPFGPIVFHIKPEALTEVEHIDIYKQSSGSPLFNPNNDRITDISEINTFFMHPETTHFPEKTLLKPDFQDKTGLEENQAPEIVCTIESGILPFKNYIAMAAIDQYIINQRQLSAWVDDLRFNQNYTFPTFRRYCPSNISVAICRAIGDLLIHRIPKLNDLLQADHSEVRAWCQEMINQDMHKPFMTYVEYLQKGTIHPVYNEYPEIFKELSYRPKNKTESHYDQLSHEQAIQIIKHLAREDSAIAERINHLASAFTANQC